MCDITFAPTYTHSKRVGEADEMEGGNVTGLACGRLLGEEEEPVGEKGNVAGAAGIAQVILNRG